MSLSLPPDSSGKGSPEILAAYLEVENAMADALLSKPGADWKAIIQSPQAHLQIFVDNALEDFDLLECDYRKRIQLRGGVGNDLFANLGNTVARRAVYIAALRNDPCALQKSFLSMNELGVDIVLAGLECLPGAWARNTSPGALRGIIKTYKSLLKASRSPEVRTVTLTQLTAMMEYYSEELGITGTSSTTENTDDLPGLDFMGLRPSAQIDYNTPSLDNSEITISGFMVLSDHASQALGSQDLKKYNAHLYTWGCSLRKAGEAANVSKTNSFLSLINKSRILTHGLERRRLWRPSIVTHLARI